MIAVALFIVSVTAEPTVDTIVPEQLVQIGEDKTCTTVTIKFTMPDGGYFSDKGNVQPILKSLQASVKNNDMTMAGTKLAVKKNAVLMQSTETKIDMTMEGPINEEKSNAKQVVMVPAQLTRQEWPIMPKTAIHNHYDEDSMGCCGTVSDQKVDTVDDCVDICMKIPECRGTSFRKKNEAHEHYRKCFFVKFDGGKHWNNNCKGSECDFDTAVRPAHMIPIPVGTHTAQNAVSLKAYASLVIDAVDDEPTGSLGALSDVLKAIVAGVPGDLPTYATYYTAMQDQMETVTSAGGLQAYVLEAIIAGMKTEGGLVSVSGPYAGITGSTLGLTSEDMSGDEALKSIQIHSPTFINAAIKLAKEEAEKGYGTGGGQGVNSDPSTKKRTETVLSPEDVKKLYGWKGDMVVPGAAVMQVSSLSTMMATAAVITTSNTKTSLVTPVKDDAACDPKSRAMGNDEWWTPNAGGKVTDHMCHAAAMDIAKYALGGSGMLLDDVYDKALKATEGVGCSTAAKACWSAAAAREFVKESRQSGGAQLIKTYENVQVVKVVTHPVFDADHATVSAQKEQLLKQMRNKYNIVNGDMNMDIHDCPSTSSKA